MRKRGVLVVVGVLVVGLSGISIAAELGPAGCGLGSVVLGDKPQSKGIQILTATINGCSGNQTFGISFGTLNCADTSGGEESATAFIEANREALAKDISRGAGETIESPSSLAGCSDANEVGETLQASFSSIFPDSSVSDQEVAHTILTTLSSQDDLGCQSL